MGGWGLNPQPKVFVLSQVPMTSQPRQPLYKFNVQNVWGSTSHGIRLGIWGSGFEPGTLRQSLIPGCLKNKIFPALVCHTLKDLISFQAKLKIILCSYFHIHDVWLSKLFCDIPEDEVVSFHVEPFVVVNFFDAKKFRNVVLKLLVNRICRFVDLTVKCALLKCKLW